MPTADLSYDSGQHSQDIPSVAKSEEVIAKHASAAIQALIARDATDLYEALGLSNYVRNS